MTDSKISRVVVATAAIAVVVATIGSIAIQSSRHFAGLEFYPLNGVFQVFGPIERLNNGQVAYKDFFPYLGVSSSVVLYSILRTLNVPINLGTVTATNEALSCFAFLLAGAFNLSMAMRRRSFLPIVISSTVLLIAIIAKAIVPSVFDVEAAFAILTKELILPGNSNLGLRSFVLYVFAAFWLVALWCSSDTYAAIRKSSVFIVALLTPPLVLWSSDYGTIIQFSLPLFLIILHACCGDWHNLPISLVTATAGWVVSAALIFSIVPDAVTSYIDYRFELQKAQFWFFGGSNDDYVFRLTDIRVYPAVVYGVIFSLPLLVDLVVCLREGRATPKARYTALGVLIITGAFLGGLGTNLSSNQNERYYLPFLTAAVFYGTGRLWTTLHIHGVPLVRLCASLTIAIGSGASAYWVAKHYSKLRAYRNTWIYVDKIGAKIPSIYRHDIEWALQNKGSRIHSTFRGYLDYIAGPNTLATQDYIIHALTSKERASFADPVIKGSVDIVLTPRFDLTEYEGWLRSTAVWFYEPLVQNYQITDQLYHYSVWTRRQHDLNNKPPIQCAVENRNDIQVLTARLDSTFSPERQNKAYIKVTYQYDEAQQKGGRARAIAVAPSFAERTIGFGVPSDVVSWSIGAFTDERGEARIELNAAGKILRIKSCSSTFLEWTDQLTQQRLLATAPIYDENWESGVARHSGPLGSVAGLIFQNSGALRGIRPGMQAVLPDGNIRIVSWVFDDQVWFSGSAFTPYLDRPFKVQFIYR